MKNLSLFTLVGVMGTAFGAIGCLAESETDFDSDLSVGSASAALDGVFPGIPNGTYTTKGGSKITLTLSSGNCATGSTELSYRYHVYFANTTSAWDGTQTIQCRPSADGTFAVHAAKDHSTRTYDGTAKLTPEGNFELWLQTSGPGITWTGKALPPPSGGGGTTPPPAAQGLFAGLTPGAYSSTGPSKLTLISSSGNCSTGATEVTFRYHVYFSNTGSAWDGAGTVQCKASADGSWAVHVVKDHSQLAYDGWIKADTSRGAKAYHMWWKTSSGITWLL